MYVCGGGSDICGKPECSLGDVTAWEKEAELEKEEEQEHYNGLTVDLMREGVRDGGRWRERGA